MLVGTAVGDRRQDLATPYLEAGIDYCSEHGLERDRFYLLAYRARIELEQGRWAEAADSAEQVLRLRRTSITPRIFALVVLGLVRARRGDPGYVVAARGGVGVGGADRGAAGGCGPWPQHEPRSRGSRATATRSSRRRIGVFERAVEQKWAVDRRRAGLLAPPRRHPARRSRPIVAEPYALQLAGEWTRAAELWREIGCPYEAALALADADEEEALRRALDELQRLGARPAAAIVARRLRERGARGLPRGPRPATREESGRADTRASSRCSRSSPTGCTTRRSLRGSCSPSARSPTMSGQFFASWASVRAPTRAQRPSGSGSPATSLPDPS